MSTTNDKWIYIKTCAEKQAHFPKCFTDEARPLSGGEWSSCRESPRGFDGVFHDDHIYRRPNPLYKPAPTADELQARLDKCLAALRLVQPSELRLAACIYDKLDAVVETWFTSAGPGSYVGSDGTARRNFRALAAAIDDIKP
jgi:hypothetical protein